MRVKFWGTRGSIPVPGRNTIKYGGNTPCVEVITNSRSIIILDAGSGIRELGYKLKNSFDKNIKILISHYHWDHIQGLPFFLPFYNQQYNVTLYGETIEGRDIKNLLRNQMTLDYFPISMDKLSANINYKNIEADKFYKFDGISIETKLVNHPTPTLTFKITEQDKCIVYMTDNEIKYDPSSENIIDDLKANNKVLINFCSGCNYLIHDTMYDEPSSFSKKGWGHSSNNTLAYFAILSRIKNLVLFHYNPDFSDAKIDELLEETKRIFENEDFDINCIAAKEGLEIEV
jgi:phosphoribosyl 1,2-cyclic phosphodiesterase